MSHDRRFDPATDQDLPSADDTNYSAHTSYKNERPTGQSWYCDAGYDERQPGFTSEPTNEPWSAFNTTSTYASGEESWSLEGNLSHLATVFNRETSSSAPPYTNDVAIEQLDPYPPDYPDAEVLAWGEASDATIRPDDPARWDLLSLANTHQGTHWAGSSHHIAQTQVQEYPEELQLDGGMQFVQRYPGLLDGSRLLVTPNSAQQFGNNENSESVGRVRPMSISTSECSSVTATEASSGTIRCPICPATFRGTYRQGNYGRHRRQKHAGQPVTLRCESPSCTRTFLRADARRKHYRRRHLDLFDEWKAKDDWDSDRFGINTNDEIRSEEHIRCDICHAEFNRAAELRRHKDSVHNLNLQQYFCKVPGCDRASRSFPRKDKLADHIARVHTQSTASEAFEHGEKVSEATYRCDYEGCEREFDQRADLLRHQRTHTDESERPHKCAQCEKSFLYPKDLKRHQATHLDNQDDEKQSFHCQVTSCEYGPGRKGFSRRDGMIRHMGRFHPEVVVKKEET